jgi:ribosomal protein S18 acetylase RimI-like enzyme
MTTEERLSMMTTPEYDPSLDLVAVAPGGALAAYCMCYISAEENARTGRNNGCTDPVATHPRFQRLGLARALLLHGLRLLRARGMDFARLGTSSDNIAMQRAAQSVGFRLEFANVWFEKPLRPAE